MPRDVLAGLGHHVRAATQLAPGRPAVWIGLRTAAATALPLALAPWLEPATATWAPIAGYSVALVDKGGAYRTRALTMGATALGSLVAVIVGTLVVETSPLAVAVAGLGVGACALGQAWGAAGASIGNAVAIHLAIAAFLPMPSSVGAAAIGVVGGAAWAMLLGLVVWPVRVYKPGRRAVSNVLDALAEYARSIARLAGDAPETRDDLVRGHRTIRDQLEAARGTLVAMRRGRRGETGRGERLLAIVHASDHMFGTLLALEEVLDANCPRATCELLARGIDRLADGLHELAGRILVEVRQPPPATPRWEVPQPPAVHEPSERTVSDHALLLLDHLHTELRLSLEVIDSLVDDTEPLRDRGVVEHETLGERLRATFDLDSAVVRHALRVAISVGTAAAVASYLRLAHGYWIAITTYLLLQPNRAATTTRAVQRGLGTVAGAIIAAAVAWVIRDPVVLTIIIVVFAGLGASVLQLNYALFSLFVTPTFVLLAELHTQDFSLVEIRVLYTVLGGALAFSASILLWPARERVRFAELMADAVEAAARYLEAVEHAVATATPPPSREVLVTRRAFGLALNNAEVALDRVIAERAPAEVVEPRMALVTFTRRIGGAINVLGSTRAVVAYGPHLAAITAFARAVHDRLHELAAAVRDRTAPPPWQLDAPAIPDPVITARMARVELQLEVLADAVAQAAAHRPA